MGEHCCHHKSEDLKTLARDQSRVLWIVLIINLLMFIVEFGSGLFSHSLSLTADSLDMLSDAFAYGSSLLAIGSTLKTKVRVAQMKGVSMGLLGCFILIKALYNAFAQNTPLPLEEVIGGVAFLALLANIVCLLLLNKHKNDDINLSSVWICSRNDILINLSVMLAAVLVWWTQSFWPDIVIGLLITLLTLRSAWGIFKEAQALINE